MVHKGVFIFVAFAAVALASEIEDAEQKKRGAGKANVLNAIPTGAQKPDYNYNIYPQNSGPHSGPSPSYQTPLTSSFYPHQSSNQYYTSSNTEGASASHSPHPSQGSQSQFVPINFVPSPGYQSKYQFVSPKGAANVLTVIPSPAIQPTHMLQYANPFYAPNTNNHVSSGSLLGPLGHGPFSFAPNYHPLSLSGSFIGQPSMVVLPQSHGSIYSNLIYPSTASNLYNYYPSTSQAKYAYSPGPIQSGPSQPNEYEKVQTSISQSISKEENGVQNAEYISPSNINSAYNSRSYSKI